MSQANDLTLEQQFELKLFADQVQNLSREEAQQLLVELRGEMLLQGNQYREIIRQAWQIEQGIDAAIA